APEATPSEVRDRLRAIVVDLPVAAYIPEAYVPDIEGRLALYQRIAGLRSREDANALAHETADRLGALPEPLANLIALVRIRLAALEAGVSALRVDQGELVLVAPESQPFAARSLPALPQGVRVGRTQLRLPRAALGDAWLGPVEALLQLLSGKR